MLHWMRKKSVEKMPVRSLKFGKFAQFGKLGKHPAGLPSNLADLPIRSVWREREAESWSFFCPLCSVPRKVPGTPRPRFRHFFQIALTAVIFTMATWTWFGWRGVISAIPLWIGFEIAFRARIRAKVHCDQCGFDPFLFVTDEKLAKNEIENHWRKIFAEKGIPFPTKSP